MSLYFQKAQAIRRQLLGLGIAKHSLGLLRISGYGLIRKTYLKVRVRTGEPPLFTPDRHARKPHNNNVLAALLLMPLMPVKQ